MKSNNMIDSGESKKSLRILIMTHAPLSLEYGAGQMVINLGDAFKLQGHNVTLWSSIPSPPRKSNILSWFQDIRDARQRIDLFLDSEDRFDLIDCPATYVSKKVVKSGAIVVSRSVQPDILYLISDLIEIKGWRNLAKKPLHFIDVCCYTFYLIQGWHRASSILCLGSLELEWMKKNFPWLNHKLNFYVNALASTEQESLSKIRSQRQVQLKSQPIKFLWIGRWTSHKGTKAPIDFIRERTKLRPDDSLTIAGCGSAAERDIPIELIESGRVKIIPKFARADLFSLLAEHEVGLFTSKVEGWGLVLNEMLESGMTVYATNTGGAPDLDDYVSDLLGSFPPPLDISIANANNYDWQRYYQKFTWLGIAEYYLTIYHLI